jgi:hypothetical protein
MTDIQKRRADEATLGKRHMLIGGKWVDSASGEVLVLLSRAFCCKVLNLLACRLSKLRSSRRHIYQKGRAQI